MLHLRFNFSVGPLLKIWSLPVNLFPLWTIGLPIYKRKKKHPRKKTRTFTRKHAKKNLTRKHAKKNRTRNLPR